MQLYLIHAAKIDENYERRRKNIIKKTLIELGAKKSRYDKLYRSTNIEENSNQILDFTREIKTFLI